MRTIILVIFVIMLSMTLKAQFILASSPDILSNAPNIENTGNAVDEFFYQPMGVVVGDMRVSVCDGSLPSFVWSSTYISQYTDGIIMLPSGIKDPDVALGEKGQIAMIVYVNGKSVVLEQYKFDVQQQGFYLQSGPIIIGTGENPNIDIYSYDGILFSTVVVWQDGNSIKSRTAGGFLGFVTPEVFVNDPNSGNSFFYPDVTIKGSGVDANGNNNPMKVSYTYIEESITDGQDLVVQQEFFSDVQNNNMQYNNTNLGLKWIVSPEEYFYPRIASPWQLLSPYTGNLNDFSVVVERTNGNQYWIESVTSSSGVLSSMNGNALPINYVNSIFSIIQTSDSVENEINIKPAIDYVSDNIVLAWTYFDGQGNTPGIGTYEVLQRKLYLTGSPAASFYSVVNTNNQNDQTAISVAGRYSTVSKALYSFSTNSNDLAYKYSHINNSSLRLAYQPIIGVYPNPFANKLHIEIESENCKIELLDMQSRVVYTYLCNKKSLDISTAGLSKGLYLLKISNSEGIQTKLIEKL